MPIDFTKLAKYGMDRFGFTATRSEDDAIKVETTPIRDSTAESDLMELFPEGLEPGRKSASGFMTSDGAVLITGLKAADKPRASEILLEGRNHYFKYVEEVESLSALKATALALSTQMILDGADYSQAELKIMCSCPKCALDVKVMIDAIKSKNDPNASLMVIAGAPCSLPGDYRAHHDRQALAAFPSMMREAINDLKPKAEEMIAELRRSITRSEQLAERLIKEAKLAN